MRTAHRLADLVREAQHEAWESIDSPTTGTDDPTEDTEGTPPATSLRALAAVAGAGSADG